MLGDLDIALWRPKQLKSRYNWLHLEQAARALKNIYRVGLSDNVKGQACTIKDLDAFEHLDLEIDRFIINIFVYM